MRKSTALAAGIMGGLTLFAAVALLLAYHAGPFCPVCGGRVGAEKGTVVCGRCGTKLGIRHPEVPPA